MNTASLALDGYLALAVLGVWLAVHRAGVPLAGASTFMAIGAYTVAISGPGGAGWPIGAAVALGIALGGVAGGLSGALTARVGAASFALTTWASAWFVDALLRAYPSWSGGEAGLTRAPLGIRSPLLGLDLNVLPSAHVVTAWTLALLVVLAAQRVDRSPAAAAIAAARDVPALASTLGIDVPWRRRATLAIAAALCAIAGMGGLLVQGVVTPSDVGPLVSIQLFAVVLLAGSRWWSPLLATLILVEMVTVLRHVTSWFGWHVDGSAAAVAIVVVIAVLLRARGTTSSLARAHADFQPAALDVVDGSTLEARGVSVAFGGVHALAGVDVVVRTGTVHAIIGPNGSGKSSLLKVLSGALRADGGSVLLDGHDVSAVSEARRVRRGIARTPQSWTATDVDVVRAAAAATRWSGLRHLFRTGSSAPMRVHIESAAARAGSFTNGAVAQAVATGATVLLLDEPAAGLRPAERVQLITELRQLVSTGRSVVLVEHDFALVREVADEITVLAAGQVLAHGAPAEVAVDPEVMSAFLGVTT